MFIVTKLYKYLHEKKSKKLQETFDVALRNALDIRDHTNKSILDEQIKRNAADREFERAEFEKERLGYKMLLKEKDLFIDSIQKMHAEKIESIKKKFEDQDKERVKYLNMLRDTLKQQMGKSSDLQSFWEGSVTYTASAVQRLVSKIEAREFLLMEIIKRVDQLNREGKELDNLRKDIFSHHSKILQESPYIDEFFMTIDDVQYALSQEDIREN
jgi:hypothetical protein